VAEGRFVEAIVLDLRQFAARVGRPDARAQPGIFDGRTSNPPEAVPRGLRRSQEAQGLEGAHGRGYARPSVGSGGQPGQRARARHVAELADAVQEATGDSVELAFVDQGYTGEDAAEDAAERALCWSGQTARKPKKGFVLFAEAVGRGSAVSPG